MKKTYKTPTLEYVRLTLKDVLVDSITEDGGGGGDNTGAGGGDNTGAGGGDFSGGGWGDGFDGF